MTLASLFGNYSEYPRSFRDILSKDAAHADRIFVYIFAINWLIVALITSQSYGARHNFV